MFDVFIADWFSCFLDTFFYSVATGCDNNTTCSVYLHLPVSHVWEEVLIMTVHYRTDKGTEPNDVMQYTHHTETHFQAFHRASKTPPHPLVVTGRGNCPSDIKHIQYSCKTDWTWTLNFLKKLLWFVTWYIYWKTCKENNSTLAALPCCSVFWAYRDVLRAGVKSVWRLVWGGAQYLINCLNNQQSACVPCQIFQSAVCSLSSSAVWFPSWLLSKVCN